MKFEDWDQFIPPAEPILPSLNNAINAVIATMEVDCIYAFGQDFVMPKIGYVEFTIDDQHFRLLVRP